VLIAAEDAVREADLQVHLSSARVARPGLEQPGVVSKQVDAVSNSL
jgi:hypothetical protein